MQGCRQQKGIDYEETFALIATMTTARVVLTAVKGWNIYKMDVTKAFLDGDLEEEVYM